MGRSTNSMVERFDATGEGATVDSSDSTASFVWQACYCMLHRIHCRRDELVKVATADCCLAPTGAGRIFRDHDLGPGKMEDAGAGHCEVKAQRVALARKPRNGAAHRVRSD